MPTRKLKALARARAKDEDWNHWQRCLAWFPMKVIKKTRDATTNYAYTMYDQGNLKRHVKSQNPVNPKDRLNESFSTDTFFANEKALGGGYLCPDLLWQIVLSYLAEGYENGVRAAKCSPKFYSTSWRTSFSPQR